MCLNLCFVSLAHSNAIKKSYECSMLDLALNNYCQCYCLSDLLYFFSILLLFVWRYVERHIFMLLSTLLSSVCVCVSMRAHVFMIALTAYSNRWNNVSKTLQAFLVNFQMILVNRLTDKYLKNVSAHIVIDYYDFVDRMNNGKKIAEHNFLSIFDSETKLSVSV